MDWGLMLDVKGRGYGTEGRGVTMMVTTQVTMMVTRMLTMMVTMMVTVMVGEVVAVLSGRQADHTMVCRGNGNCSGERRFNEQDQFPDRHPEPNPPPT
jgi:hypothetical protein